MFSGKKIFLNSERFRTLTCRCQSTRRGHGLIRARRLRKLPYKERLLQLNLHTLKYRRLRGDMIEVVLYKIIQHYTCHDHDMYDRSVTLELPRNVSSTRGNKYKLQNHSFHYNLRKKFFAARVVNVLRVEQFTGSCSRCQLS